MTKMKKIILLCLCVAIVIGAAGCSMAFVNEERDNAQVVAEVNGAPITKEDLLSMLDAYAYQTMGTDYLSYEQTLQGTSADSFKNSVLDEMIGQELLYQEAQKEGMVDDSEENRAEKRETIMSTLRAILSVIETQADDDGLTGEERDAFIHENYQEMARDYGYGDIEGLIEDEIRNDAITAMTEKLNAEVSYTEEDAREYYDLQAPAQAELIEKDRNNYNLYKSFGEVYAYPEEARYVKNLLLQIPEETQTEISALRSEGSDAEADVMRDEALATIKDKADEVLEKAKSGEDFDALIAEYGEDTGMQQEPAMTKGYLVTLESDFVQEFEDASLALENEGDISDLVATDFGYHIIKYETNAAGMIPFEDVKDSIIEAQLSSQQNVHYYERIEELKEGATIKKYENRYNS
jgi:parvulin-like peptidyl-prolyl isomerase